ncbi:hypothetical protein AZE42_01504 [Rhizopogon vesiculosus]|uniref:Uncharacterized protein n=1 Tax=Rhizopogon vesiculosus TaxID=180088 RepID=A0A1J8RDA5_9AGAM|nr:hypothetical protein AZE42_01504 [Rhizopogon vesiculosus]
MSLKAPVMDSGRNRGQQYYVAPEVKEVRVSHGNVAPPSYKAAMANVQRSSYVVPPRLQNAEQRVACGASLMRQLDINLDQSPFPKQLGIPAPDQRLQTNSHKEPTPLSPSLLLASHDPSSPEPASDIKSALRASGIEIGIPSTTRYPEPPTDQSHPPLDQVPASPITPLPPVTPICDLSSQKSSLKPFQTNSDGVANRPTTSLEQPKRLASPQSPVDDGGMLKPVRSVHVNLPPPSNVKEMIRNVQPPGSSIPRVSVEDVDPVTIKSGTPEPLITPITSNNVKLPPVPGRSSLHASKSFAPEPSDTTAVDVTLPASRKNEMCRKWYIGHSDDPVKDGPSISGDNQDMHRADSIRPASSVTSSTTGPSVTKIQIPEMKPHGTVKPSPVASTSATPVSAGNNGPRKVRPVSSVTSSSAGSSALKFQKPEMKLHGTAEASRVASNNATPDKVQPASSVTSSAGSSAPKVHNPKMKSHDTGKPSPVSKAIPKSAGNKARDKVRPTPPVTSSSVGSSAPKVQNPEMEPHNTGRSSPVSNATPRSVGNNARDKVRPAPPVTSNSAGSSAPKVQSPEMKPHDTAGPPPVTSTRATPDKVQPTSSVTSSAGSSATKVRKPEVKSNGTGRLSPVALTNASSGSTGSKAPDQPDGCKSQQVYFRGLQSRCMHTRRPFPHERPPNYVDKPDGSRCTRPRCCFLHERPANNNASETNSPLSCTSSPRAVRNNHDHDTSVSQKPHSTQNTVSCNTLSSRKSPPSNEILSPPIRRNEDFGIPVTIADHTVVRLKDGFEVQGVTTGFESRWVHIGDLPPRTKESQIRSLLEEYGQLDELFVPTCTDGKGTRSTIKAQYSTAAQAMKASKQIHGRLFQGRKLTAKLPLNTTRGRSAVLNDSTVHITWTAPQRLGYAGYATLDEAKAAIATASGFVMKGNVLTADLYEGLPAVGAYNVMFCHVPADAVRKDLEQFGNAESIMFERPNYQSLDDAREAVLRLLHSCGDLSNFDLTLPIRNGVVRAWATFETHADASNAKDYLDGQYPRAMGGKIYISARHVQSLIFVLPFAKYKMLEGDITGLRMSWGRRFDHDVTLSDRLMSPDGPASVRISATNVSNLGVAKAEFEQLQHGEVVTLERKPVWDGFFSQPSGQLFLRKLEHQYPGIEIQTRMGKILLLGRIAQRQLARKDIMTRFQELRARQKWYIPLSGKVVGAFVSKDLLTLQESVGRENCQILLSNQHTLLIRGNEQTYRIACEVVEKVQNRHAHRPAPSPHLVCPVCFSEASVPTRLSCGHSWCTSCLQGYLASAVENKAFPLTCLGNDASCTERIPLSLTQKILSGDDFAALCEASFWSYVHARSNEFHHCPTPDCAQVYRVAPVTTILQCPSCLVRICSTCHTEAHDGLTCEERDTAQDKLFHEWAATHDVKNCPGCKTPIERSEGCNHMTCVRCQTHICWVCLETFPKGDGIYDHMRFQHGGIGL